ncbi:AsmA family protein [Salmonella enterica subsp. enterica]|nr:AsmA family protein [Salmonella enterica subsp. enterica]
MTFGRDGQPATLVAKTVDIGLSIRQLTAPLHVDTILLQDGTLNISVQPPLSRLRPTACNFAIWRSIVPVANGG